ncbi:KRI1-like family C-terminal-domain-containing protein [Syncephalastrum racemosum]|uniref:KRI1-like family C-terminal-domain-containing protein n=1 Tax=Syncephalastrum racemosum TaxID=13706 RepID=A0A1X2H416_SYNRA|nr:KRI1-like family C-terminal-domain-containing protein [Syncephalastrum racemosum]
MSDSESEQLAINIREREDESADYVRPELLKEAEREAEARAAAEAEAEGSGSEGEGDDDDEKDEESEAESESESDDEEDEEAYQLTPALDTEILQTIAALRSKDPRVYDSKTRFYTTGLGEKKKEPVKKKEYKLKDYERDIITEHGGYVKEPERIEDDDDERRTKHLTFSDEQDELKNELKKAAFGSDNEDEEEDEDGFLVKREKTTEEATKEEEDYKSFLLNAINEDKATAEVFKEWNNTENPDLSKEDSFLMNYLLNRGWMDNKKTNDAVPSYEDLTNDDDLDKDEEYLDEVDRFESKYNFRFEEEPIPQIISHSRDIPDSLRRKRDKRKKERERRKLKKQAEKEAKMQELIGIRHKKMREIADKLKEIQEITGNDTVGLEKLDLEGDFDPAAYDKQMDSVFDENYYEHEEDLTEKPTWDDDIDVSYAEQGEGGEDGEEDIEMDADYLPGGEKYGGEGSGSGTSAAPKRKIMDDEKKAKFNELMEEYYSLNYEDVIGGDLPTRFKYNKVEPEDYGLTAEQILLADDKELNKYVGMKMLAPYRDEKAKEYETKIFRQQKKKKLLDFHKHLEQKGFYNPEIKRQRHAREERQKEGKPIKKQKTNKKKGKHVVFEEL